MTPLDLFSMLREILADECGCKVCWGNTLIRSAPMSWQRFGRAFYKC